MLLAKFRMQSSTPKVNDIPSMSVIFMSFWEKYVVNLRYGICCSTFISLCSSSMQVSYLLFYLSFIKCKKSLFNFIFCELSSLDMCLLPSTINIYATINEILDVLIFLSRLHSMSDVCLCKSSPLLRFSVASMNNG